MEASLTCWRYFPAVSGVRLGPMGQGWVLNQSAILVWYSAVVCLSRNMLGTLRFLRWYGHRMGRGRGCGGPPEMRKEFQKSLCLSETVLGERARCTPSSVGVLGDR